jgi:hypothetical protein
MDSQLQTTKGTSLMTEKDKPMRVEPVPDSQLGILVGDMGVSIIERSSRDPAWPAVGKVLECFVHNDKVAVLGMLEPRVAVLPHDRYVECFKDINCASVSIDKGNMVKVLFIPIGTGLDNDDTLPGISFHSRYWEKGAERIYEYLVHGKLPSVNTQ